ncbi:IS3 family transposase [Spirosoma flavum]|uniref:IS3 family transposase n=1 Tax=Spirosoma flavum TaxID=2048557 RepID=A0ABW6ANM1_9BACT
MADHWDNAVAESFFRTLKCEMANHTYFATRAAARLATFEYIEGCGAARAVQPPTETFSIELPHA